MNLTILDRAAFETLNPLELKAYLVQTGWSECRILRGKGSYWNNTEHPECDLPLPLNREIGDFADRMRDAVDILSKAENRSPVEVFKDLERAGQDIIRVRLVSPEIEDGTVPLNRGVELLTSARNAVYASAWAAFSKHRRPYYYSRPPKAVSDFMENTRLGQTERGSYVVTIETPIPPELEGQTEETPEPFGRRVTRTLATALEQLLDTATRGTANDVRRAVNAGVSANLCASVADALNLSGSHGEVEVRVSWARTRRAPQATPDRIVFPKYLSGVLSEAAGLLRSIAEIEEFELVGTVYQLRQETEAIILGWVDEQYRRVRVPFLQQVRDDLIKAYDERSIIRCTGELRRSGKAIELVNARSFSIDDNDDDGQSI